MSFTITRSTPIKVGGKDYSWDPQVVARLSHPGLLYERTRAAGASRGSVGAPVVRHLPRALQEHESTCYGVG